MKPTKCSCGCDTFHIEYDDSSGIYDHYVVCTKCGSKSMIHFSLGDLELEYEDENI